MISKKELNKSLQDEIGNIGTKNVDETDIQDNYTLRYDGVKDKIVYVKSEIDREPPAKVTNISVKEGNTKLTVNYTPPLDSDYMGTRLVYNTTADPIDINDGTVIANFISGTDITGLLNDTKYFIRLFPYDMSGNYNTETGQSVTATPTEMKIYGVKIEKANSNPETSVTYTDNAIGIAPMKSTAGVFNIGSWGDKFPFNAIKPCLVKNGVVNYYLNPNDYTKKADGSPADITTGTDGDVMVEFPKIYWKMSEDSTHRYIQYSDKPFTGAKCLAHMRGITEKDKCYISVYLGFETGGKLRSLSGKTPTVSKTIGAFRTIAQANGVGYDQMSYYQLLMLQVLYTVAFKNLDSQTALGRGFVDGNTAATTTGGTNAKGIFYGETTGKQQMKFCGIEDFYGNCFYWIDGFFCDASRNILITNQNFNDTGSGYTNYGQGATVNLGGYISDIQGGTETGFVAKTVAGSATTHYADQGNLDASCLPRFGGVWNNGDNGGAFYLQVVDSDSNSYSSIGARLAAL